MKYLYFAAFLPLAFIAFSCFARFRERTQEGDRDEATTLGLTGLGFLFFAGLAGWLFLERMGVL